MTRGLRGCVLLCVLVVVAAFPGCAARKHRKAEEAKIVGAQALYEAGMAQMARGNLRRAKVFLERIQYTSENRKDLEPLVRLAFADLAFYAGDDVSLIDARSKYLDFVTLYGDHPRAPYAQFQAGVCSLKQVNHPMRDQSQTLVAIQDLREVERRYPNSPYVHAAADLLDRAEANLAEHDYQVGRFYFKKRAYLAAADRFRSLLDKYPRFRGKERVYFYLGQALLRMNNDTEGRIYLDKLVTDYPNGEYTEEAKRLLAHANSGEKGSKKG